MSVVLVLMVLVAGLFFRHFYSVSWQRGFKEGFHQGLQQRVVKIKKTTSEQ